MKRRIKVFESGKYPQGEFSAERVKKIFSNAAEKVKAIFTHTSRWKEKGKNPVEIGEFENFEAIEKDGKTVVYADVNFNEKGKNYYEDGIINGVSVEINDDKLSKIAVLPMGINPAVEGAEFENQGIYFEFEEEGGTGKVEIEKIIEALAGLSFEDKMKLLKAISGTVTDEQKKGLKNLVDKELADKKPVKTEEEIEKEVEARFEKKQKVKEAVQEFMEETREKITPAMKKAGIEQILREAAEDTKELEFAEGKKKSKWEVMKEVFAALPKLMTAEFEAEGTGRAESEYEKNYKKARGQE